MLHKVLEPLDLQNSGACVLFHQHYISQLKNNSEGQKLANISEVDKINDFNLQNIGVQIPIMGRLEPKNCWLWLLTWERSLGLFLEL